MRRHFNPKVQFRLWTLAAWRLCVRPLLRNPKKILSREGAKAQRRPFNPKVRFHLWTLAALRLCVSILRFKAGESFSREGAKPLREGANQSTKDSAGMPLA